MAKQKKEETVTGGPRGGRLLEVPEEAPRGALTEFIGVGVAHVLPGTSGWVAYKTSSFGTTEIITPPKRGTRGEDKFRALARAKTAFIETFVTKGLTNKMRVR